MLVRVPFYCMVNLIAGREVVPELMQGQMTGEAVAREAEILLEDGPRRAAMKAGLDEVRAALASAPDRSPAVTAANIVQEILEGHPAHVS